MLIQKNENLLVFDLPSGAIVYNKLTKKSYRLGKEEYALLKELDGEKTIEEPTAKTNFSVDEIKNLLSVFDSYALLASSEIQISKNTKKKHTLIYEASFLHVFSNPILKIIFDYLIIASVPVLIFAIIFMQGKIDVDMMIKSANIIHIVVMDIILAISVSLHEIFHAIAAKNNGAFCAEIGYTFDFFVPSAYTTLCGVDEIKSKGRKVQVFFAGIAANAVIATISLLLMNIPCLRNSLFVFLIFSSNLCLILINSITSIKSDVYYILCSIFDNMNLKEDATNMIKGKGCRNIGNVIYFTLTYIIEPAAIVVLLVIAFGKIGGKFL